MNQLDLRLTKILRVGRTRVQGMLDLYNVTNVGVAFTSLSAYGPRWQQPTTVIGARLLKFSGQVDF